MKINSLFLTLLIFFASLLLVGCLGEADLPALESRPVPPLAPPAVDPTVAALPRQDIFTGAQVSVSNQQAPLIPHDMIGRTDCLMCHKQGVSNAPRIPDGHRGLESNTCQTCHASLASLELSGAEMYQRICTRCHGEDGEGGAGPALNTKSYLRNVTDEEIRAAIVRGLGESQMLAWGDLGLLTDRQIDELVEMIRAWEPTAPEVAIIAHQPPSAAQGDPGRGSELFAQFCSGCHGIEGETVLVDGFVLSQAVSQLEDDVISKQINDGTEEMPSFHALLTRDDINDLLAFMRETFEGGGETSMTSLPSFTQEILPLFNQKCVFCHGASGGWQSGSYDEVMNSGINAPVVIPGDAEGSLLVQKLRGTQAEGAPMPPGTPLSETEIDLVVRWVEAGAPDN